MLLMFGTNIKVSMELYYGEIQNDCNPIYEFKQLVWAYSCIDMKIAC